MNIKPLDNVSIIVAVAKNGAIGLNNELLYRLPNDLKRFKALTTGHTIIMGRKTFESLPKGALPNRRNIVLSRQEGLHYENAECYRSIEEADASMRRLKATGKFKEVSIVREQINIPLE